MALGAVLIDTAKPAGERLDPLVREEIDEVAPSTVDAGDIETEHLQDLAVTTAKLNNGAVTSPKIATKGVKTANVDDAAIGTPQLADNAVTAAKAGTGVSKAFDAAGNAIENAFVFVTTEQYDILDTGGDLDPNATYMISEA